MPVEGLRHAATKNVAHQQCSLSLESCQLENIIIPTELADGRGVVGL